MSFLCGDLCAGKHRGLDCHPWDCCGNWIRFIGLYRGWTWRLISPSQTYFHFIFLSFGKRFQIDCCAIFFTDRNNTPSFRYCCNYSVGGQEILVCWGKFAFFVSIQYVLWLKVYNKLWIIHSSLIYSQSLTLHCPCKGWFQPSSFSVSNRGILFLLELR